jgi:aminoglycoside phosphotransferase (APT) family kinase protein
MDNGIKMKLDRNQIGRLVQDTFGTGAAEVEELKDGWANTAYRIGLMGDQPSVVLKVAPLPGTAVMRYESRLMQNEIEAMALVENRVPVPKLHRYDDSCTLIPSPFFFMEWLEGTPYNKIKGTMTEEERYAVEHQLGKYSLVIGGIKGERFGSFGNPGVGSDAASWREVFRDMLRDVLADGRDGGVVLPFEYEEAEREIGRRLGVLDGVREPRLVHWDLWDGNVFVRNGVICGLIDWERAFWGDPLMEFYFGRMCHSPAFRQGYGAGEADESEQARRRLYDLYLDLILLIECTYRKYNNPQHERWAWDNLSNGWKLFLNT